MLRMSVGLDFVASWHTTCDSGVGYRASRLRTRKVHRRIDFQSGAPKAAELAARSFNRSGVTCIVASVADGEGSNGKR